MKKGWIITLIILLSVIPTLAEGRGHENCRLCHLAVEEGNYKITVKPNYDVTNPSTGRPYCEDDALCMRCHKMEAKSIHPVGIVPDITKVNMPPEAKGKDGMITCNSCHEVHEDNKNYKLLRWASDEGRNISKFCVAYCHVKLAPPSQVNSLYPAHIAQIKR